MLLIGWKNQHWTQQVIKKLNDKNVKFDYIEAGSGITGRRPKTEYGLRRIPTIIIGDPKDNECLKFTLSDVG